MAIIRCPECDLLFSFFFFLQPIRLGPSSSWLPCHGFFLTLCILGAKGKCCDTAHVLFIFCLFYCVSSSFKQNIFNLTAIRLSFFIWSRVLKSNVGLMFCVSVLRFSVPVLFCVHLGQKMKTCTIGTWRVQGIQTLWLLASGLALLCVFSCICPVCFCPSCQIFVFYVTSWKLFLFFCHLFFYLTSDFILSCPFETLGQGWRQTARKEKW